MRRAGIFLTLGIVLSAAGCLGMDDGDLTEPLDSSHCPTIAPVYCAAGDVCVDLSTSADHCGACGVACTKTEGVETSACVGGACVVETCEQDRASCDDDYKNGCETDLRTTKEHCGACGHACATQCVGGVCDDPIEVSAGYEYTCVVRALGSVWCWGNNAFGNLGDNTTNPSKKPLKTWLSADQKAIAISAGKNVLSQHTCALLEGGKVACWGANQDGQLGTQNGVTSHVPQVVAPLEGSVVAQVDAGGNHTCAVTSAQELYCWGSHQDGALGIGMVNTDQWMPTLVGSGYDSVVTGDHHTCAHHHGQTDAVACWGANLDGQLGDGSSATAYTPEFLSGLADVETLGLGTTHSCGLFPGGIVQCWGQNASGQLGSGAGATAYKPKPMDGLPKAQALFVGFSSSAALTEGGLWVWGDNSFGQLGVAGGDPALFVTNMTTAFDPKDPVRRLAIGGKHACAILASSRLVCWGDNSKGQLGDDMISAGDKPIDVELPQEMP